MIERKECYSFIQLFDEQAKKYATHSYVKVIDANGEQVSNYTFGQVENASKALALQLLPKTIALQGDSKERVVVGFMSDHNVDYLLWILALFRCKVTLMCLSPRNSKAALEHLITKTQCSLVLATTKYSHVVEEAANNVAHSCRMKVVEPLDIVSLVNATLDQKELLPAEEPADYEETALIIHSSGSTAFPKPIRLSNRYVIRLSQFFDKCTKEYNLSCNSNDVFLNVMPLFHIAGFFPTLSTIHYGGSVIFHKRFPPDVDALFHTIEKQQVSFIVSPPIIIEQLALHLQDPNTPQAWKEASFYRNLKGLYFAGAPLKEDVGDFLAANFGINLCSIFGITETNGFMSSSLVDPKFYNPLKPLEQEKEFVIWEETGIVSYKGEQLYHLSIKAGYPGLATGVSNRQDGGYDTNDLFYKSKDLPGYYCYVGRRDDTIVFNNGEKTNPLPMEATLRQSPVIFQAVVCGSNRPATLALIELDHDEAIKHTPETRTQLVYKAIQEANKQCPNHARILHQMVYILPLDKHLPSTDKGTAIRKRAIAEYADVIDSIYDNFEKGIQSSNENEPKLDGKAMTTEELTAHLTQAASDVMEQPLLLIQQNLTSSLFDLGLNSLLATYLRNKISNWFDYVPQNFVYQHPSIVDMVQALKSSNTENEDKLGYKATNLLAQHYIERADKDFGVVSGSYTPGRKAVYLLTGVTGSIGSFVLQDLLYRQQEIKVYCLVRAKTQAAAAERLVKNFHERQMNVALLEQFLAKETVQVYPMELEAEYLGFTEELYHHLKSEVTVILHCAWLLDFNQPLEHFDRACIQGMYNLLKFAYRGTNEPAMHVHTLSSVSATGRWKTGMHTQNGMTVIPELPLPNDSSECAMPMGYAQSKYVVERLFNYLATEKQMPTFIERVGQVCGDSLHGVWNYSEQYSLMIVGGAGVMHKMPDLGMAIDWIPVDYAARAINDIMVSLWKKLTLNSTPHRKREVMEGPFHIVNTSLTDWDSILQTLRDCGLTFKTIPLSEWVQTLAQHETNPAYRLMAFYESSNDEEAMSLPIWSTENTRKIAPSLGEAGPVNSPILFQKYLTYWRNVSHISF